jgi:hypothetical protein
MMTITKGESNMRELVIRRILECSEDGEILEGGFDVSPNELADMPDEELLDLFQEMVFNG